VDEDRKLCLYFDRMIQSFKDLLLTDTGKDTSIVFAGTLVNVIVGGLFFILAPRILGPSDFGIFSTVVATGVVAVRLSSLGVETGILKFAHRSSNQQNAILSIALKSYLFFGLIIAVIGFFIAPILSAILGHPEITLFLRIAFGATVFFHLTNLFVAGLQARQEFLKASIPSIANNVARIVLLLIGSYFFTIGLYFLTVIYFAVTIISTIIGKYFLPFNIEKIDKSLASDFFKFNIWVAFSLTLASIPFDNYFLLKLAGPIQTGLYAAPLKILTVVYEFGGNFTSVLASRFASFDNKEKVINFAKKTSGLVLLFSLGLLFLILIADPLVILIFGKEFSGSIQVLKILAIGFIFFFLSTIPSSIILYYFGKSQISFAITFSRYWFFVILLFLAVPSFEAIGAAYAFTISEFLAFSLMLFYVLFKLNAKNVN